MSRKYLYVWLFVLLHVGIGLSVFLIDRYHLDGSRTTPSGLAGIYFALLGLLFDRTFTFFMRHPEESKGDLEQLRRLRIPGRWAFSLLSLVCLASAISHHYGGTSPSLARAADAMGNVFLAGGALVSICVTFANWRLSHSR